MSLSKLVTFIEVIVEQRSPSFVAIINLIDFNEEAVERRPACACALWCSTGEAYVQQ